MFKILQLLLTSILFFIYSDDVIETIKTIETMSLNQNVTTQQKSFYKNIDKHFYDYDADVNKKALSTKEKTGESHITSSSYVFKWIEYADSWEEFKSNYGNLNLSINLELAFNWYNIVWTNDNGLSISLNDITSNDGNWIEIINYKKMHEEAISFFNFMTYAKISYAISVNEIYVKIRFKLETERDNPTLSFPSFVDYDNYYFTIDTRHVRCNSTFDYNSIYALLNENVNNKTLSLESDTSTSLLDKNNILIAKIALDQLIERALENHYQQWKKFISDYTYSDISNQAIITVKFDDPNTNESIRWDFKVIIKFNLSQDYWNKNFKERLKIFSGKVIDPNSAMIEDKPFLWEDKKVYSTTATIRFDGAKNGSETMKVNGIPIQVIDNTFTYEMIDNQEKDSEGKSGNEYEVLIEKHDLNDFNKVIGSYKFKYLIKQSIPNLDLKWYSWNPDKPSNENQKKLITPNLPDGSSNPNYDPEINIKTGTKKQIIWVKHKAQNPFPLDPLNRNGDIIKNNVYEEGFIAEGSVSGKEITQNFKDSWIKSVQRSKVNPKNLQPIGNLETIKADNSDSYFSLSGTYFYIITDQKGHTANKFIIIDQNWKDKYAKFLNVLNNPDIAMPFWSTIHGLHLKNYLVKYKYLNSTNIQNLTFEQVVSYWKEYVSDIKSQRIGPDNKPKNNYNLSEVKFETIKMNKSNVDKIRNEIINQIQEQLNRTDLIYDVDYELKPFDDTSLKKLLLYDSKGSATINLTITALDTSTSLIGTNTIKIINNINYDATKAIDLKKIKFDTQIFYFNNFTVNKLIEWILLDINQIFEYYKINLNYPYDYGVKPFDLAVLQQFLTSTKNVRLVLTIYGQNNSLKTKNSTTLELVNDSNASVAPDKPPKWKSDSIIPNPSNKEKSWFSKKGNLFLMSIIAIFITIILGTFIIFKYRFKRGIGFKKNNKK